MSFRWTPAVKSLVIACIAIFLAQQSWDRWGDGHILATFALVPSGLVIHHRFWQLLTYAFLHADPMHLILNMMMLVFIGAELEASWGTLKFLRYYFFCAVSAGLIYLLLTLLIDSNLGAPMVGASGAIYGLLLAYGLIYSERTLLFMMLFPMKAKHFIWLLAGVEFMTTVFSPAGGLAGAAHLGGMAAGFVYLWVQASLSVARKKQLFKLANWAKNSKAKKKRRPDGKHLKLVINNRGSFESEESSSDDNPKTWH